MEIHIFHAGPVGSNGINRIEYTIRDNDDKTTAKVRSCFISQQILQYIKNGSVAQHIALKVLVIFRSQFRKKMIDDKFDMLVLRWYETSSEQHSLEKLQVLRKEELKNLLI